MRDMRLDSVEIDLTSEEEAPDYPYTVSTKITAYLTSSGAIDKNTLSFDCDPIGNNYRRTYLRVKFRDWTTVTRIRDFLAHHFSDMQDTSRTMTIPIEEGYYSLTPFEGGGRESEDFEEIRIRASGTRIEFGGMANMQPYIQTYEEYEDNEPQDENNADKLLNFLNEITSEHPISYPNLRNDEAQKVGREVHRLFNQYSVTTQLNAAGDPEDQIQQDYQKAVREFKDQEYNDAVRDIGLASETLIEHLCHDIYEEDEIPDNMAGRLNKLDNTEDGLPSYIGKAVSPAWWLRNKSSHPVKYEITKADAHYALLCFQTAVETYVEDYQDTDIDY